MAETDLTRAMTTIDDAKLCFQDKQLLESFVEDAIDPSVAARYLLQRDGDDKTDVDLQPLLSDWKELVAIFTTDDAPSAATDRGIASAVRKRDGDMCRITGFRSSLCDPLLVAPILSLHKPIPDSLHEMFGAFVGHEMQQRILSHDASLQGPGNYWLVRKAAAAAMSQGWIQFQVERRQSDEADGMQQYYVAVPGYSCPVRPHILDQMPILRRRTFASRAASDVSFPDKAILRVVSQFAAPIRWFSFAREVAVRRSQPPASTALPRQTSVTLTPSLWGHVGSRAAAFCLAMWRRIVPAPLRIHFYRFLGFLGDRWYGPTCSLSVQQLPFGMYLKRNRVEAYPALVNEQAALQLVHQHTRIPVPRPLDLVSDARTSYLLMTRAPGKRLGAYIDILNEDEAALLARDLQQWLTELRAIPWHDATAPPPISGTLGGPLHDHRVNMGTPSVEYTDFKGPFATEDEFNTSLQMPGAIPGLTHSSGHRIVFTHGDLNMRNVLMHNGRLSGIVDWENAGWCPEYWDLTKAFFITKLNRRWLRIVDDAFRPLGDYRREMAIERQFWDFCY